jgi:hypothetical protein
MSSFYQDYLSDAIQSFRSYKKLADRCIDQVSEEEFFAVVDEESNSIAVLVKHVAGNLHSRWRDFLTTDGEKPERERDQEFEIMADTRESLLEFWNSGWESLFGSIEPLTDEDFAKIITIRGEPHTIVEAINRQLTHYSYHIGQIVFLGKHLRSSKWNTLSVPRNRSAEYNRHLTEQQASGLEKSNRIDAAMKFAEEQK